MSANNLRRGLAVTAVSALASVGLPLAAHANSVNEQIGGPKDATITLYSQSSAKATTKSDGNTTVRLEAGASADINQVQFQVKVGAGAWTTVGSATRNDDGAFALDWTPTAAQTVAGVQIKVVGHSTESNVLIESAVKTADVSATTEGVSLMVGSEIGVYQSPFAGSPDNIIVTGSVSGGATVDINSFDGTGAVAASTAGVAVAADKTFAGVLNIQDKYTYGSTDQIVIGATAAGGADATEAYSIYKQVITTVTATPKKVDLAEGQTTDVTVTVADQSGKPIAGAQVVPQDGTAGDAKFTDAKGQAVFTQGVGTKYYYANATTVLAYAPEVGDKRSADVTLGQYVPAPDHAVESSAIKVAGKAYDRDETPLDQIKVQVVDQKNQPYTYNALDPLDDQKLTYVWEITPFAGGAVVTTAPAQATVAANGTADVPFPAGQPSGTYVLKTGLTADAHGNNARPLATTLSVKVGNANFTFDGPNPAQAPIHTTATLTGKLVLEDGTALGGRKAEIVLDSSAAKEYKAVDGTQTPKDAILVGGPTVAITTAADGSFSAKVEDLKENDFNAEIGNKVVITSAATPNLGDVADGSTNGIDFYTDQVPDGSAIAVMQDGAGTPGIAENGTITLKNKQGTALRGVQVTLTLDHGFFTDGSNDPAAKAGERAGELKSLGSTITRVTDVNGEIDVWTAIERDAGFDDDTKVTARLTASVDGLSGSATTMWDTRNALNITKIDVVRTPGQPAPAPEGTFVKYDLYAWDQFGNPVRGVTADIDTTEDLGDDDDAVTWGGLGGSGSEWGSDLDNGGDFWVQSDAAGSFGFKVTSDHLGTVWNNTATDWTDGKPANRATDSLTEEWYAVTPTSFAITGPTSAALGAASTVVVTVVDQKGNPVEGLFVEFVRTGDPSPWSRATNGEGEATYVFNRTTAGVETVTAVVRGDDDEVLKQLVHKVTYGAATAGTSKITLRPTISTGSRRGKDVFWINAQDAGAGAAVTIVRANGRVAGTGTLDANGNVTLRVKDLNRLRKNGYQVRIAATAKSNAYNSAWLRFR